MICPNCHNETPDGRFCTICGGQLPESVPAADVQSSSFCPNCGTELFAGAQECPSCGLLLDTQQPQEGPG